MTLIAEEKLNNEQETIQNNEKEVENIANNAEEIAVDEPQSEVEQLQEKLKISEDKILRLYAEMDNLRKRMRLDMESARKYRCQELILGILPALDNFERATNVELTTEEGKNLLQGMKMVYQQLLTAIKAEGVEVIESLGKQFDPHMHEAIMQADKTDVPSNEIVEELQKGYKLKDRVIRPAMVKVNK